MPPCPDCHQPASKRDGRDAAGRQRYACRPCGLDFTTRAALAFAGHRWPAEVILLAVRWSLSHPLSAASVMELLAERGIDVSKRTVLWWVQTLAPCSPPRCGGTAGPWAPSAMWMRCSSSGRRRNAPFIGRWTSTARWWTICSN